MRCRRDRNHYLEALKIAVPCLFLAVSARGSALADVQKVGPDGTVHRINVEAWPPGTTSRTTSTALRHIRQYADGSTDSALVPGTDDLAIDRDPAIDIDPATGNPVLVWSRNLGSGFDIFVSRFDGASWSAPQPIVTQAVDDTRPDIKVACTLIHVTSRQDGQPMNPVIRTSIDRLTLIPVFGPETLPIPDSNLVPVDGQSSSPTTAATPPTDDAFFMAEIPPRFPGDPGRVAVWGIRDAPVPVDYCQGFLLPSGVSGVQDSRARWLHKRFVVSYAVPSDFYYSIWYSLWGSLQVIDLNATVTSSDARIQMEDMIRREAD